MTGIKKHNVVAVDGWINLPALNFDHDFTKHQRSIPSELPERMYVLRNKLNDFGGVFLPTNRKDATIVITSGTPINRAAIESAPNLELISVSGVGTDHIDVKAARECNVSVCRVPAQNTETVSEHAFALYVSMRNDRLSRSIF
jgi:glycerate dehydrogenase